MTKAAGIVRRFGDLCAPQDDLSLLPCTEACSNHYAHSAAFVQTEQLSTYPAIKALVH